MGQVLSGPALNLPDVATEFPEFSEKSTKSANMMRNENDYWGLFRGYWWEHWSLSMANAMAWYEFATYASMEPWLTEKFFYGYDSLAWLAFGLTFVAQPLGGFVVGAIADKFGRRPAILSSLCVMFFSTTGQGMTPDIPIGGTVWLLTCRVLQGLASGGELGAITVFMAETIPRPLLSMSGFIVSSGVFAGFVISTSVAMGFITMLTPTQMSDWGWRMPFIMAGIPVGISLYKTWSVQESQEFEAMHGGNPENENEDTKMALQVYWRQGVLAVTGLASAFAQQYLAGAYVKNWLVSVVGISSFRAFMVLNACQSSAVLMLFPIGIAGDIYGVGKMNLAGALCGIFLSVPSYWLLLTYPGASWALFIGGVLVPSLQEGLSSGTNPWICELFPTEVRGTAVSLYFNVAQSIGGFAPLICDVIPGDLVPGWYSVVCGLVSAVANYWCLVLHDNYKKTGEGIRVVHLRDDPY